MRVLVTGFAPFGEHACNPSWEAALALDGVECEAARIAAVRLPVSWTRAAETVAAAMRAQGPVAVVMAGLAAGRPGISVEQIFVNARNGRDEDGVDAHEAPVTVGGPIAVGATLPTLDLVQELRGAGIPADASRCAGTYVCNATAYAVLSRLTGVPLGFLHVPATPAMVARRQAAAAAEGRQVAAIPSMDADIIRRALRIAAGAAVRAAIRPQA